MFLIKFNNWTLKELIEYISLSKVGMDYTTVIRCSGEIHIFNGEPKDKNEDIFYWDDEEEVDEN